MTRGECGGLLRRRQQKSCKKIVTCGPGGQEKWPIFAMAEICAVAAQRDTRGVDPFKMGVRGVIALGGELVGRANLSPSSNEVNKIFRPSAGANVARNCEWMVIVMFEIRFRTLGECAIIASRVAWVVQSCLVGRVARIQGRLRPTDPMLTARRPVISQYGKPV